jgi:hypothetical protein
LDHPDLATTAHLIRRMMTETEREPRPMKGTRCQTMSDAKRPPLSATSDAAPRPTRTAKRRGPIDEHAWQREMNTLRRIGLVLSAALAAVVAHMVIDGPELIGDLTAALILLLLICALVLRRQGHRLRPEPHPRPDE